MRRLIDADLLMRKCEKWLKPKAPDEDEMVSLTDIAVSMLMEIEEQPTMFEMEENGKNLMEIYKLFNIDGSLKRKLTVKEMVMLYHIADVMRGGRYEE